MKEKILWPINIVLVLGALFLILHLSEVELPTLGKAQYYFDKSEGICVTSFGEEKSLLDADLCCSRLQMQLTCEDWEEPVLMNGEELIVNKRCYIGKGAIEYFVNMKTYNYCKIEGFI